MAGATILSVPCGIISTNNSDYCSILMTIVSFFNVFGLFCSHLASLSKKQFKAFSDDIVDIVSLNKALLGNIQLDDSDEE
jgi:hypothetical protein